MGAVRNFIRSRGGNVGVLLAISAIPVIGGAGVALDLINRNYAQARVQAAIDAGALAGASMRNATPGKIRQAIKEFAEANGVDKYLDNPAALSIEIADDGAITVTANGDVDTSLSRVLGIDTLNVSARSEARRGESGAEIAMVLDNTKSMEDGGKINTLKTAAEGFVDALSALNNTADPDRIRLSLVPYAQYVNVGLGNRNASWMHVEPDATASWADCRIPGSEHTVTSTWSQDGVSTTGSGTAYDYYTDNADCTPVNYPYTWNGCVGSREYPYNVDDNRPDIKFVGPRDVSCPTPITPLTSNKTDLDNAVTALNTDFGGDTNTYIPSGLAWGWRTLTSSAPYSEAVTQAEADNKGISKHLLLMTDGVNTVAKNNLPNESHRNYDAVSHSYTGPQRDTDAEWQALNQRTGGTAKADADQITSELCENIKSAGITVYTVAFQVTDNATKDLLRNCATSPAYYYDATDSVQLTSSFNAIAAKVAAVRLSK